MWQWLASLLALVIVCPALNAQTADRNTVRTEPGLWLSRAPGLACGAACERQLLERLQRITGLPVTSTGQGQLHMSEQPAPVTGSATARAILRRALQSGQVFMIEDHSGSPAVNFGQLDEGLRYEQTKPGCLTSVLIWRVRLDLSDFRRVHAPASVRESFDLGFTLLHELLHGLGYEDAKEAAQLGGCETLLNQARAELGLPQRAEYLGVLQQIEPRIFLLRLPFRDSPAPATPTTPGQRTKRRDYQLLFLPELSSSAEIATQRAQAGFVR